MKILENRIPLFLLVFLINSATVYSQLGFCTGNSGEPIFNEDFGTGLTNGPQLPAGVTTYQYVGSGTPSDGQYTISSTTNYYDWHNTQDHTPDDVNGKCLIVNADYTPGEFFRRQIDGLCEFTSYEFSAWLLNLLPATGCSGVGIPINVKFQIWDITDSTLLASGDTGNIPGTNAPLWRQYGLTFQTLSGQTSVILKMINNGNGGCGNDLAIDDIIFKTCGDSVVLDDTLGATNFESCEEDLITTISLTATPDFSVFATHAYQWQVSSDAITWNDIVGETTNSLNAPAPIPSGTLYYRVKFAESAANLENDSCNSISEVFQIKINGLIVPNFNPVDSICNGDSFTLPSTSNNNVTGTWSPAINNTASTTYTFTPDSGQCATIQTLTVTVNQPITPIFEVMDPICKGTSFELPSTSINNINGTWSPAFDNTTTATYTFVPAVGGCATNQTITVIVNEPIAPFFNLISEVCKGETIETLPNISLNGITGTWSPNVNNTDTTTYTFTPSEGECANLHTHTIEVQQPTLPLFDQVAPICLGDILLPLPSESNNGIIGTWSPALNNSITTNYIFTPNADECASSQNMTIVVNPILDPQFNAIPSICAGDDLSPLPTTSINNIEGTWSPAINNSVTTTYTFTPIIGECATTQTMTIIVKQAITPLFDPVQDICFGDDLAPLPLISTNDIFGSWSPELDSSRTTTYTFTPDAGECPILAMLTIVVNSGPELNLEDSYVICTDSNGTQIGQSPVIDTNLSENEFSFLWKNNLGEIVGSNASFIPSLIGIYSVTVKNLITACQSEASTTVVESSAPTLEVDIISDAFSDNGIIKISTIGNGNYEFSLDNGPWQDNPLFSNVSAGNHTVSARDKNGCGQSTMNICLIGAPKFFTPNGDGINDTWNIKGVSCINNANLLIYDRYGKLLKEMGINGSGWNGIFNGKLLPTDDYWYVVKYQESETELFREYKGHFTLKR